MRHFLDTNILVSQFDDREPGKQHRARALVQGALTSGDGFCSSQVVNEFCNLALRRFAVPMTPGQCTMYVDAVVGPLCTVGWSLNLARDALLIVNQWHTAWYDALIIAAAREGGAGVLYTEDLQHGMRFGSMRVVNPFLE